MIIIVTCPSICGSLHEQLAAENAELRVLVRRGRERDHRVAGLLGQTSKRRKSGRKPGGQPGHFFHVMIEFSWGLPWLVQNRMTGPVTEG